MIGTRLFLIILSIIFFYFAASGQSNSIRGVVEDTAKAPISGATVILRNRETGLDRAVSTDNEGKFIFSSIGDDTFEVIATASGFARASIEVTDRSRDVVVALEPAGLREEVTVVSGSRQEELRESLNTKVDVITRNDIINTGYETVGEALREVPGVITRRGTETSGVAGQQVQGIDSRQVLVLLDGQPLTGARGVKSGVLNLDRQSTGRLDSIEVVKGASSALYGSDAIGGVINLRTREQALPFSAGVTVAGGNLGVVDARGEIGFVREKLTGFFSVERHKHNGFDLAPSTFTAEGSGYHRYDAYGKIKYQFNDKFSLIGFANSYWNDALGRVAGEPSPGNANGLQTSNIKDESQNYGVTADWAIDGRSNLQLRGYYSRFDEYNFSKAYPSGAALPDGNLFERFGKFDATFSRVIGERHFLQAGTEFATNRYSGLNRLQNDRGEADTRVLWLQDKINIVNRLTLTVGGRFDHHSVFGSAVSPKIGLNYRVTEHASLRASWGRGFRAPDLGQLFYRFNNPLFGYQVLGNERLSPEHAASWQVGGEFSAFNKKARLGINYYRNDVRNLINSRSLGIVTLANVDAILAANNLDPALKPFITFNRLLFVYQNLADVYTQGVELDGSYILPAGFAVSGSYTFLEAMDKSTTPANRFLTGRHKHHAFAKLAYENSRYGINANLRQTYFGKWWNTATSKAPAFQLWDLYGSKRLVKSFVLYGSIDNLFDSKDKNAGTAAQTRFDAGRTFRVGLRRSFDRAR
jgi:outer membrane receptor for ferrienterochelin and colicins